MDALMVLGVGAVIVRLGEQQRAAFKVVQVLEMIVNHDVAPHNFLGTAKDDLVPGDEGEMFRQPRHLFDQAGRIFGGGGDDI